VYGQTDESEDKGVDQYLNCCTADGKLDKQGALGLHEKAMAV
jgi:hypothetical protein